MAGMILSKFESRSPINREGKRFQLVGIASLLIASKIEDARGKHPSLEDCCEYTDYAYSKKDVADMEFNILKALEWRICKPTLLQFSNLILSSIDASADSCRVAKFYMEKCSLDGALLGYRYSEISCCCVIFALHTTNALLCGYSPWCIQSDFSLETVPFKFFSFVDVSDEYLFELCKRIRKLCCNRIKGENGEVLSAIETKYRISSSYNKF